MDPHIHPNPTFTVVAPGFLTTVQDLGRFHCAPLGMSPAGAADPVSMRLGNMLVGNPENSPVLEMTLVGGTFRFDSAVRVALTGSNFGPALDNLPVPVWQSTDVAPGQLLTCGSTKSGARCYLCIAGGVVVPPILSSASTHLLTSLGGFEGRSLKAGDVLEYAYRDKSSSREHKVVREDVIDSLYQKRPLRITLGPQGNSFGADAFSRLSSSVYVVREESNRMGLRLLGPELTYPAGSELVTEGVSLGAIQVPRDGMPIILSVEHPTTGGYPKIANVILPDMHRVGQFRPRDEVTFDFVTFDVALSLLKEREALLSPQHCLQTIVS
jgi:antagonist of KipI